MARMFTNLSYSWSFVSFVVHSSSAAAQRKAAASAECRRLVCSLPTADCLLPTAYAATDAAVVVPAGPAWFFAPTYLAA